MEKRGYLDISFGWMFAIIVGIFVLTIAFFIAQKVIETKNIEIGTSTAKELGNLLNPFETGIETGTSNQIDPPTDTRIYLQS